MNAVALPQRVAILYCSLNPKSFNMELLTLNMNQQDLPVKYSSMMLFKLRIPILDFLAAGQFDFELQLADGFFHTCNGGALGTSAVLGVRKLTCFIFRHNLELNSNEPKQKHQVTNRYIRFEGPTVCTSIQFDFRL